jgi:hypothetical protein
MNNDLDEIKRLIDRYMEGETSIEEQDRLARFFRSSDIPEELKPYQAMFDTLSVPIEEPSVAEVDAFALANGVKVKEQSKIVPMFLKIASVAAVVALVFLMGYHIGGNRQKVPTVAQVPVMKEKVIRQVSVVKDTVVIERPVVVRKTITKEVAVNTSPLHDERIPVSRDFAYSKDIGVGAVHQTTVMTVTSPEDVEKYFKEALDAHQEIESKEIKKNFKSYGYEVSF